VIYSSSNTQTPSLIIQKAQTPDSYRDQIVDVVTSRKKMSEMYFAGLRINWPRLYDLWRGTWTGRFHPHKNNVHIPLIFSAIWADAARKSATSLNVFPIISFLGYGPDDMPIARKREGLISAQFKDDDIYLKQVDFQVAADLYGKAVMQVGWKRKEEVRIIESIDRLPLSGRMVKSIKKGKITSFDGPVSENLDLLDFFPQPGVKRLKDMKWVIRRYFLDLDDVRYLAAQGIFNKAEVARLEREGGVNYMTTEQQSMVRRFAVRAGMDDESIRWMDRYLRPIEILELWGTIPSELSPDGVLSRVITVANHRYLFRNNPNPFWHGVLPFVDFSPTPDPHYYFAPGKAETVEKLQIVGNRYLNQSLDAADLIIDPMWFYDRAANLNTRNLYARPGRFIPVDGNPSAVIANMKADLSGLTVADEKIAQVREFAQMGTGLVEDAVQGLQGSNRQTAREFIGRRESAGTRLLLESRIYEESCLEPLANMFVALDKQFLDTPVEVLILGDGATIDPVTRQPIPNSRERLDDFDLVPNYAARAVGATSSLSKGMKQERLIQLLQAMASPLGQVAMGQINAINFWRGIFREFEVPNINEIFMTNEQLQAGVQQVSPQQGLGGVPTSGQIVQGGSPLGLPGSPGIPGAVDMKNTLAPA
jgi:hypothetical protein